MTTNPITSTALAADSTAVGTALSVVNADTTTTGAQASGNGAADAAFAADLSTLEKEGNEAGLSQPFDTTAAPLPSPSFTKASLPVSQPAVTSKSIRVNLIVKSKDIGFERLHSELSSLNTDSDRVAHIKRVLMLTSLGQSAQNISAGPSTFSQSSKSVPITFRVSKREIGLEKIYSALVQLGTSTERNHFIKRFLFDAYSSKTQLPKQVEARTLVVKNTEQVEVSAKTESAGSHWTNAKQPEQAEVAENAAAARTLKRKQMVTSL